MKICIECGKELTRKWQKKFCSSKCSAKYNNPRKGGIPQEQRDKISASLKKYFRDHPEKVKRGDSWSRQLGLSLQKTKRKSPISPKNVSSIAELPFRTARKILRRLNLGCSRCGWREGIGDIHHIYGRKVNNADSHDNLCYLCPNCHRLVGENKIKPEELIPLSRFIPQNWKDYYYG